MADLWERMTQMFGHRWVSAYGPTDTDNVWLACLNGLTPDQLRAGLRQVAHGGEAWPPTAPEFRKLCEQAQLQAVGLPSPDVAYREAAGNAHRTRRHKWSHAAVYVAGRETGWFDLRESEAGDKTQQRFIRCYEIATRRVLNGEELDAEIPLALEDTREKRRNLTERDRKQGKAALENLKSLVGL